VWVYVHITPIIFCGIVIIFRYNGGYKGGYNGGYNCGYNGGYNGGRSTLKSVCRPTFISDHQKLPPSSGWLIPRRGMPAKHKMGPPQPKRQRYTVYFVGGDRQLLESRMHQASQKYPDVFVKDSFMKVVRTLFLLRPHRLAANSAWSTIVLYV
jgi:hypothetical protein